MSGRVWRGRAVKLGDNVDTDVIAPGDVISFGLDDAEERRLVRENAFRAIRPRFHEQVRPGDILFAGRNFGLGSHREPANRVLVDLGFSMLIAESIARLFFRNAIAIGFHALQVPDITQIVEDGEDLEVDLERWRVRNIVTGAERPVEPYSSLAEQIIGAGGIIGTLKARMATEARFK